METVTIKVKWFNNKTGWGFADDPKRGNIFIHYKDIQGDGFKSLREGQMIRCRIEDTDRGPRGKEIIPL